MRGEWKIKARNWFEKESWFFDLTTRNFGRGVTGGTVLFLCYKCIITTYWLTLWTWRLVDFHVVQPRRERENDANYTRVRMFSDSMTNWTDSLIAVYLVYSTFIVILVYNTERKYGTLPGGNPAKWYHYIVQLLFQVAVVFTSLTSIIFWVWEFHLAVENMSFYAILDIHAYLMPMIVMAFELCTNRIHFRLFHFLYTIIIGLLYVMGNYVAFLTDPKRNKAHEMFIDWASPHDDVFTIGVLKLTTVESLLLYTLGFIPAIHLVFWILLKFKFCCCVKSYRSSTVSSTRYEERLAPYF